MKDDTITKLKSVMKQALQQFFEESGINQILLQVYQSSKNNTQAAPVVKKKTQVQNILKKNAKAMASASGRNINAGGGKIASMKRQGLTQLMTSYEDQDGDEYGSSTPMLNAIKQSVQLQQPVIGMGSSSRVAMNQNIDPLTSGLSVLETSMPDFLKRGLAKVATK